MITSCKEGPGGRAPPQLALGDRAAALQVPAGEPRCHQHPGIRLEGPGGLRPEPTPWMEAEEEGVGREGSPRRLGSAQAWEEEARGRGCGEGRLEEEKGAGEGMRPGESQGKGGGKWPRFSFPACCKSS